MDTSEKKEYRPLVILILIIIFVYIISWLAIYFTMSSWENRGQFGDMFGALNTLFSGLAFAGIIYAIILQKKELVLQRKELKYTRDELKGQKEQLQAQNQTMEKQNFENSFFQMLRFHSDIVNNMTLIDLANQQGRDCFKTLFEDFMYSAYISAHNKNIGADPIIIARAAYSEFFSQYQAYMGHYFRNLYSIVKFVNESKMDNKKDYTRIVRAQLSSYELLLLFYNSLQEDYKKFKVLIERYALLENMDLSLLIKPDDHVKLYDESAYGDQDISKYIKKKV